MSRFSRATQQSHPSCFLSVRERNTVVVDIRSRATVSPRTFQCISTQREGKGKLTSLRFCWGSYGAAFLPQSNAERSRMNDRHAYRNNIGSPRSWTHVAMPCFSWSRFGGGNDPSVVELFPSGYVDRKFTQCSHCFHSVSD